MFPIVIREGRFNKCRGRFWSCTHIEAKEIKAIVGSKEGLHGSIKRPKLSQSRGPLSIICFMSLRFTKVTAKKNSKGLMDKSWAIIGFQFSKIHEWRFTRRGHKPLNMHTKATSTKASLLHGLLEQNMVLCL